MSQKDTSTKEKRKADDILSEDFKPPKKKSSQKILEFTKKTNFSSSGEPTIIHKHTSQCPDVGRAIAMLERVTAQQDRAQECIERLLTILSHAAQEESSEERDLTIKSKK